MDTRSCLTPNQTTGPPHSVQFILAGKGSTRALSLHQPLWEPLAGEGLWDLLHAEQMLFRRVSVFPNEFQKSNLRAHLRICCQGLLWVLILVFKSPLLDCWETSNCLAAAWFKPSSNALDLMGLMFNWKGDPASLASSILRSISAMFVSQMDMKQLILACVARGQGLFEKEILFKMMEWESHFTQHKEVNKLGGVDFSLTNSKHVTLFNWVWNLFGLLPFYRKTRTVTQTVLGTTKRESLKESTDGGVALLFSIL